MSKTYYVCKYTPVELLTAFGGDCEILNDMPQGFDLAEQIVHPNICGFGKAVLEAVLDGKVKELVLVIPLEKITIKEITDKAQVIRPTFYNHFQDKYEVVERIIKDEILQPIRPLLQNDMIDESMILIFTNLQKEKEFYTKLAKTTGQNSFEEIVRKCVEELLLEFMISKTGEKVVKDRWLTPAMIASLPA